MKKSDLLPTIKFTHADIQLLRHGLALATEAMRRCDPALPNTQLAVDSLASIQQTVDVLSPFIPVGAMVTLDYNEIPLLVAGLRMYQVQVISTPKVEVIQGVLTRCQAIIAYFTAIQVKQTQQ